MNAKNIQKVIPIIVTISNHKHPTFSPITTIDTILMIDILCTGAGSPAPFLFRSPRQAARLAGVIILLLLFIELYSLKSDYCNRTHTEGEAFSYGFRLGVKLMIRAGVPLAKEST